MNTTSGRILAPGCLLALCWVLAAAAPAGAASEIQGVESLRESGTNTQPYTRVSPSGNAVHYYVPNGNYNPYTSQPEKRVGPPAGFGPNTQGNWYGNMGGTNYPSQKGLNIYEKERRQ